MLYNYWKNLSTARIFFSFGTIHTRKQILYIPCAQFKIQDKDSGLKIPHTGNTRPSRTCVIQEYGFYTMSLSQYHCVVNTLSRFLYHDSMSIP